MPCIELAGLSETQKRAYIIADNKLALNSGWDEKLLRLELIDLKGLGFNLVCRIRRIGTGRYHARPQR